MSTAMLAITFRKQLDQVDALLRSSATGGAAPPRRTGTTDLYDVAQESVDYELSTMSRARLRTRRQELIAALERLADGRYGLCEDCGAPIPTARLRALPTAATCVPCQEQRERIARHGEADEHDVAHIVDGEDDAA